MKLRLARSPTSLGVTIGTLFIDGEWECWTLEDEIREVEGEPVAAWKVAGDTAIPHGMYEVRLTPSQRFHRLLPQLINVPGFSGIRIHPGNTIADTSGCILVGQERGVGMVLQSRPAFEALMRKLLSAVSADDPITIDVEDP